MRALTASLLGAVVIVGFGGVSAAQEQKVAASPQAAHVEQPAPAQPSMGQRSSAPAGGGMVIFDFEKGVEEWAIPDWAQTSADYVGKSVAPSQEQQSHGQGSLQVNAAFPGGKWTGAYIERMMYVTDWSAFSGISADVFLPQNAPEGIKARFILTVGDKWEWTEMNRGLSLKPGEWTTITANLKPGSQDWKFFPDDKFRKDVRKIGIRFESDSKPVYTGPMYVDNIQLDR